MDETEKLDYIEKEFKSEEYQYLVYFLTEHPSTIEKLKNERSSLYYEIFSTIFFKSKTAFQNTDKILPHIDLEKIIPYIEEQIKVSIGDERKKLVSLHDFYSITLYGLVLLRDFSPIEIFALDPLAFQAQIIPHEEKKDIIEIILDRDMYNYDVDRGFVIETLDFSRDYAGGYTDIAEYLVSKGRSSDFLEVFESVHDMIMDTINTDEEKEDILESLYPVFVKYEVSGEFEKMSKMIDITKPEYYELPLFSKYFSHVKFKNREYDRVISFISSKYDDKEVKENPHLAYYYGSSLLQTGEISQANDLLETAYEISRKNPNLLIPYFWTQFHLDKEKGKEILKKHFDKGYPDLTPRQVFLLLQDSVENNPDVARILFEYFEKTYVQDGIDSSNFSHYNYLLFKVQYFKSQESFDEYIEYSEKLIDYFPQLPGGYCKLGELYSNENLKYFDLKKAEKYGKKQAQVEGVPEEYYKGIMYTSANKPEKAIKNLKTFVENNQVGFDYINAYKDLSINHFKAGNEEKGCKWGRKWFERYDTSKKDYLYQGAIIEGKKEKQNDYEFMVLLSDSCWKLKEKIQPEIDRINLERDRLDFAEKAVKQKNKRENLEKEIQRLENELKRVKKEYINIDDLDEEKLNELFSKIKENFNEQRKSFKSLNEEKYLETKNDIENIYPLINSMPNKVKKILIDTEFIYKIKPKDADFSGILVNFGKVFEIILDEKISKPFMENFNQEYIENHWVEDKDVNKLFPQNGYERRTINLRRWKNLIEEYVENDAETEEEVTKKFVEELRSVKNIEKSKSEIEMIRKLRNSSAHNSVIDKKHIDNNISDLRKAVNELFEIFY